MKLAPSISCYRIALVLLGMMMAAASPAYASSAMTSALCQILCMTAGPIGAAAATLGVLSVGISASLGKVSPGMALTVGSGIAILFGATAIAATFGITNPCGCP